MAVEIKTNIDKVKWFLENREDTRDSDLELIAQFWKNEGAKIGHKMNEISANDFLGLMAGGEFTSSESIRRCRQKVQEEYPELRGKNYKGKQSHQEKVKGELGYGKSNN